MDTQLIPKVTYTLTIDEQQRRVIHAALRTYISATPNGGAHDEFGSHVAGSLEDMFDPEGTVGPLSTTGVNGLTL